jgi:hypothetical protein
MQLQKGDRVKHLNLEDWGIGQIIEDPGTEYVKVFFLNVGEKKLRNNFITKLKEDATESFHLDHLKITPGKSPAKYRTINELKTWFLSVFPEGFYGSDYLEKERDYKVAAHNLFHELLNKEAFEKLLADEEYDQIATLALKVVNKTTPAFPNEKIALKAGLKDSDRRKLFSLALFNLLFGQEDMPVRFEAFSDNLQQIGINKWTVATYFLFISDPATYMFLKPNVIQKAAEFCAFELNYRPELNWHTYASVLNFSKYLLDSLVDLKPRDMIDIQSFIWCAERISDGSASS